MNNLISILKTPVKEANLSVRLLNNCFAIGITDICQLVKLYLDRDERLISICGSKSLSEIEQLMRYNNISQDDYPLISELFRLPFLFFPN